MEVEDKNIEAQLNNLKEPIDTIKPIDAIKPNSIVEFIQYLLSSNEQFNDFVTRTKIVLKNKQTAQIKDILNHFVNEIDDKTLIDKIIKELLQILSDNKIELYEIPALINIIYEILKNIHYINITGPEISILIKLLVYILIETETIKMDETSVEIISSVIDTSLTLLNKPIHIKIQKCDKCWCF